MALLSRRHDRVFRKSFDVYRRVDRFDQSRFEHTGLNYDATLRNLELVGESATHVPQHAREFASHINWRLIIATRNRLMHGYLGIDNDTLWSIIKTDIPSLLNDLRELKNAIDAGQLR